MNDIHILQAKDVTWQEYKNLRLEALQKEPQAFGSSYQQQKNYSQEEWQNRLDKYIAGNGNWMVFALAEKHLVGMMGAFQTEEDKKNNTAQIIAVYVQEAFRGNGIAKMLMEGVLNQLKGAGIKRAVLCVNIEQTSAVKLYERFGFQVTATEKRKLGDGKYYDEYDMEKML